MHQYELLKEKMVPGKLYRREDLEQFSRSVDRHLNQLLKSGELKKLGPSLYHLPKKSKWGEEPLADKELVTAFLKDDRFLLHTFNNYNGLGLGLTQLYNNTIVYNHKRHGQFKLGNRVFDFQRKPSFPEKFTKESLLVDMLNHLAHLAEDENTVLKSLRKNLSKFNRQELENAVKLYGKVKSKKLIAGLYGKKVST